MADWNLMYAMAYDCEGLSHMRQRLEEARRECVRLSRDERESVSRRTRGDRWGEAGVVLAKECLVRLAHRLDSLRMLESDVSRLAILREESLNDLASLVEHRPLSDRSVLLRTDWIPSWRPEVRFASVDAMLLRSAGYSYHVRRVGGSGRLPSVSGRQELWSDCEPWALDALRRSRAVFFGKESLDG
jgi:hypothetical protein